MEQKADYVFVNGNSTSENVHHLIVVKKVDPEWVALQDPISGGNNLKEQASKAPPFAVKVAVASIAICTLFFLFLFCYLGVSSSSNSYTQNLVVAYADLDGDVVGQALTQFLGSLSAGNGYPSFQLVNAGSADALIQGVTNYDYWAAVFVNRQATANLMAAVTQGQPYDPTSAITFVYDEGRFQTVVASRITGPIRSIMPKFLQTFAASFISSLQQSNPVSASTLLQQSPQLLVTPILFNEINLHPATNQLAAFGLTVGMILLVVFTWVSWMASFQLNAPAPNTVSPSPLVLHLRRSGVALWLTFVISLSFTLVWQGLGASFPSAGAWVSFWMVHWLQMGGYVFVFSTATNLVGLQKAPSFLLFTITFNATAAFNELSLASLFYQWGHALPMRHAVLASRTILYGTKDNLGVDIGALAIWFLAGAVVALATVPRRSESEERPQSDNSSPSKERPQSDNSSPSEV